LMPTAGFYLPVPEQKKSRIVMNQAINEIAAQVWLLFPYYLDFINK